MKNLEIKAAVADMEKLEQRLSAIGASLKGKLVQEDTYFIVGNGRLKIRKFGTQKGELIFYERNEDGKSDRWSHWEVYPLDDPDKMTAILSASLGVRGFVKKVRTLYMFRMARIHLDRVEGLGDFVEIESVATESSNDAVDTFDLLINELRIDMKSQILNSYIDML